MELHFFFSPNIFLKSTKILINVRNWISIPSSICHIFSWKIIVFWKIIALVCVSVDDIQLSCYRFLTSLYSLGTGKNIYVEKYNKLYFWGDIFVLYPFLNETKMLCWVFTDSFQCWVNVYLLWLEPCLLPSWNPTLICTTPNLSSTPRHQENVLVSIIGRIGDYIMKIWFICS